MSESYSPRTVAIVSVGSLLVGFGVVFGGGMAIIKPRSADQGSVAAPLTPSTTPGLPFLPRVGHTGSETVPDAGSVPESVNDDAGVLEPVAESPNASADTEGADASTGASGPGSEVTPQLVEPAQPAQIGGITLGGVSISRCFNQGNPAVFPSAQCGRLDGLDRYLRTKAAEIAGCSRTTAHGRLGLVMDFRFSTKYFVAWGATTSNIARAGLVAACIKEKITPLPFSEMDHEHDRYLLYVPIDW